PKGVKISDTQLAAVRISSHAFHGDWNYTISPNPKSSRTAKTVRVI
ncbi:MAG: ISAzo13-like element transposase-related protein, partial [Dongiaceae bacterium]